MHGARSPAHDGPTEQQIDSARQELESLMSAQEREKLHAVSEDDTSPGVGPQPSSADGGPVSARTIRRWREELLRKYGDRI